MILVHPDSSLSGKACVKCGLEFTPRTSSGLVFRLPCGHTAHVPWFDEARGRDDVAYCPECDEVVDMRPGATAAILRSASAEDDSQATVLWPMSLEMVQHKVWALLNDMSAKNFDETMAQLLQITAQSKYETNGRTLRQVIDLVIRKATGESLHSFMFMYAKLFKYMLERTSPDIRDESILDKNGTAVCGSVLAGKYLLNRCQEDFEHGWLAALAPPGKDTKPSGGNRASDERKCSDVFGEQEGFNFVQFLGELYNVGLITERVIHDCLRRLLFGDGLTEARVKSFCTLLRTVGAGLDTSAKSSVMMDAHFSRIQEAVSLQNLPSHLKYLLMDLMDLRMNGWVEVAQ